MCQKKALDLQAGYLNKIKSVYENKFKKTIISGGRSQFSVGSQLFSLSRKS